MYTRWRFLIVLAVGLVLPGAALAETAPSPVGGAVLVLSGDLGTQEQGAEIQIDMDELKTLPVSSFRTTTIWTEGEQTFTGVDLRTLLDIYGVDDADGSLVAVALNDYSITIPLSEIREGEALLAYERNGEAMSVRDKGPLWIVYPYDSDPQFQNEVIYSRSIWQVSSLRVER